MAGAKISYIDYGNRSLISHIANAYAWTAMSVYTITTKNSLGTNIPIGEFLIYLATILGAYLAFRSGLKLKTLLQVFMVQRMVFAIAFMYGMLTDSLFFSGVSIYIYFVVTGITNPAIKERKRKVEMVVKTKYHSEITTITERTTKRTIWAGALGTFTAMVVVTFLHVEITDFTVVMIGLTFLSNVWELYWICKL